MCSAFCGVSPATLWNPAWESRYSVLLTLSPHAPSPRATPISAPVTLHRMRRTLPSLTAKSETPPPSHAVPRPWTGARRATRGWPPALSARGNPTPRWRPGRDRGRAHVRRALARGVLRVVALDAHEPRRDEPGDERVAIGQPRMGEHRYAARLPEQAHRVRRRELLARHVGGLARAQVLVEGLAHRLDVAVRHHDLRHVR